MLTPQLWVSQAPEFGATLTELDPALIRYPAKSGTLSVLAAQVNVATEPLAEPANPLTSDGGTATVTTVFDVEEPLSAVNVYAPLAADCELQNGAALSNLPSTLADCVFAVDGEDH